VAKIMHTQLRNLCPSAQVWLGVKCVLMPEPYLQGSRSAKQLVVYSTLMTRNRPEWSGFCRRRQIANHPVAQLTLQTCGAVDADLTDLRPLAVVAKVAAEGYSTSAQVSRRLSTSPITMDAISPAKRNLPPCFSTTRCMRSAESS
jgi:hypothetical protein